MRALSRTRGREVTCSDLMVTPPHLSGCLPLRDGPAIPQGAFTVRRTTLHATSSYFLSLFPSMYVGLGFFFFHLMDTSVNDKLNFSPCTSTHLASHLSLSNQHLVILEVHFPDPGS